VTDHPVQTPKTVVTNYEDAIPQLADVDMPEALRSKIEQLIARYPEKRSAAIPALMAAQEMHGWLSPDAIRQVAAVMRETPAWLESVASFYDMFERTDTGRHTIYMCTNISCMLRGANAVMAELAKAAAGQEDIYVREFECLGACDLAPVASVDGKYVGPLTPQDARTIIDQINAGSDVLPTKTLNRPAADPTTDGESA
jgi:NADH:ubiquinone oxidoreductase subunit E